MAIALKYFVPDCRSGNYYHLVTETLLALYELLDTHGDLERRECRLWYQGRYAEVVQLFSAHPVTVLPLDVPILDGHDVGEGIETLKTTPLDKPRLFERLVPLSDYLMSLLPHVPDEPGITLLERAGHRRYAELDKLRTKLAAFGLPVRVARFEAMPFQQQVSLARNTTLLVAPHGAGAVNQIFMPHGARVLELYPMGYFNWHTGAISAAFGHQYAEIESRTPGVIGRMRDDRMREFLDTNPWPTRAQTEAMGEMFDREFMRSVRDVASYSIDPDIVIEEAERLLGANALIDEGLGALVQMWLQRLRDTGGDATRLVRSDDGALHLLDGRWRREIGSPLVGAILETAWGPAQASTRTELAVYEEGPPVVVLVDRHSDVFIVAGGKRHRISGLPAPFFAMQRDLAGFEVAEAVIDATACLGTTTTSFD